MPLINKRWPNTIILESKAKYSKLMIWPSKNPRSLNLLKLKIISKVERTLCNYQSHQAWYLSTIKNRWFPCTSIMEFRTFEKELSIKLSFDYLLSGFLYIDKPRVFDSDQRGKSKCSKSSTSVGESKAKKSPKSSTPIEEEKINALNLWPRSKRAKPKKAPSLWL